MARSSPELNKESEREGSDSGDCSEKKTTMVNAIPGSVKRAWESWNIRGIILLSLSLQIILIFCAPLRKRTSSSFIIFLTWTSYLLADWAASFVVGLISHAQQKSSISENSQHLLAFWAPFLLLHLGGPDTITAFSLEDNALWLRHLIGLLFQVIATAYVFLQTIPSNKLWPPTVLMFLAGICKYAERTRALYLASLGRFRESLLEAADPGPNYAKLMEEYSSRKDDRLPTRIELTAEPEDKKRRVAMSSVVEGKLRDFQVVHHAYRYYNIFKGLIVDTIFSFRERDESREFFHRRTAEDAFKVIVFELNFIYEALFTKVVVLHSLFGYLSRLFSIIAVLTALALFCKIDKTFEKVDIRITYTLLIGAIALDLVSLFMFVFSDWTVANVRREKSRRATFLTVFLSFKMPQWTSRRSNPSNDDPELKRSNPSNEDSELKTPLPFRRWSESLAQFNLIKYCLRKRSIRYYDYGDKSRTKILHYIRIPYCKWILPTIDRIFFYIEFKDLLDSWLYVSRKPLELKLWKLIFDELLKKSKAAEDAETTTRICSARGSYVLEEGKWKINVDKLIPYLDEVAFDDSLLLWHIATELCYRNPGEEEDAENKEFSKTLSDYMLYLLVMQPTLMSAIAGIGQIRFRDTCAETKKFFDRRGLGTTMVEKACEYILDVNTEVMPVTVKGDRSKSVLFKAAILAKELNAMKEGKWRLICLVWVEILGFAASHCRADSHAQLVAKGGEFLTFVWLLMAHFGLGEQFQINEGHARAKLIVGK